MTSTSAVRLLLASSLAIAILGLTPAHADEPAQPIACSAIPACAEQLKKAKQLTKEQRDDDALQAFLVLYSQFPDPRLCVGIGRMLHRRGQYEKAARFYQRLLDSGVEQDPQNLAKVRRFLAEARAGIQEEAQPAPAMHPPPTPPSAPASAPSKPAVLAASAVPASPASGAQTPASAPRHTELRPMQAFPSAMPSTASTVQAPTAPASPPELRPLPIAPTATGQPAETPPDRIPIGVGLSSASSQASSPKDLKPFDPVSERSVRPQERSPIYKRWWFWTAIGTVTAGVIVGAALGAYAQEPSWPGVETVHPFP